MKKLIVCLLLVAGSCHDKKPPQPTAEQSDQLNDAEDILNGMEQNEEGPEANASSPSNSSD